MFYVRGRSSKNNSSYSGIIINDFPECLVNKVRPNRCINKVTEWRDWLKLAKV
jgi:hypothetical protein